MTIATAQDLTSRSNNPVNPPRNAAAVTPNDSTDLNFVTRALYIGTGGTLSVNMAETGDSVSYTVYDGQQIVISVARVRATGTTATGIVAQW